VCAGSETTIECSAIPGTGTNEICDGLDNDCDGVLDNGFDPSIYFADSDIDSYGDLVTPAVACTTPVGYVSNFTYCNASTGLANPGTTEICDGIDNDCNGSIDEVGCAQIYCATNSCISVLYVDDDNGLSNRASDDGADPDTDEIYIDDLDAMATSYAYDLYRMLGKGGAGPDVTLMKMYDVVVWNTGATYNGDASSPKTLTVQEQANLMAYLDSGGSLLLSSQDLLWDLTNGTGSATSVFNTFLTDYLGVQDAWSDAAGLTSVENVIGDPVSGDVNVEVDLRSTRSIDSFEDYECPLYEENGTVVWDTSISYPGELIFSPSSSTFPETALSGPYALLDLTDADMTIQSCLNVYSMWSSADGATTPQMLWVTRPDLTSVYGQVPYPMNYHFILEINLDPGNYRFEECTGMRFSMYPDKLNSSAGFTGGSSPVLKDPESDATTVRFENGTWRTVFFTVPYESLISVAERRKLLKNALDWVSSTSP